MRSAFVAMCLSAALATGCSDDGGTAFEGVYALAITNNPTSCDVEGPAGGDPFGNTHFFVRHDSFFGESFVVAVMCKTLDECRMEAAETDTLFIGEFTFERGDDKDGWLAARSSLNGTTCDGIVMESRMTGAEGVSVSIREETKSVMAVPMDSEGCDRDAAIEQAATKPCTGLRVITGTFVEGI